MNRQHENHRIVVVVGCRHRPGYCTAKSQPPASQPASREKQKRRRRRIVTGAQRRRRLFNQRQPSSSNVLLLLLPLTVSRSSRSSPAISSSQCRCSKYDLYIRVMLYLWPCEQRDTQDVRLMPCYIVCNIMKEI